MSANVAVICGIVLSVCTVFGCIFFVPLIYREISLINEEVALEVSEFNVSISLLYKYCSCVKCLLC